MIILSSNNVSPGQLEIRFYENGFGNMDSWMSTLTTCVPVNTWIHLVISYPGGTNGSNPGTPLVYSNGTQCAGAWGSGSGTHGGAYVNIGAGPMVLGITGASGNGSAQNAANFAVWNRALSVIEIKHLYNSVKPLMAKRAITLP